MKEMNPGDIVVMVSMSGWTGETARLAKIKSVGTQITLEDDKVFSLEGKWVMSGKVFDADYRIMPLLSKDWKPITDLSQVTFGQ
jgi:hypothetical protein